MSAEKILEMVRRTVSAGRALLARYVNVTPVVCCTAQHGLRSTV
jgi:hypothetical protein